MSVQHKWYMVGGGPGGPRPVVYTDQNEAAAEHGRQVVVIDPEDREQIERLSALYGSGLRCTDSPVSALQAALRELANPTPPKPDEPTGLGAVVVDGRDMRFVRCADGWLFAGGGTFEPGEYRNPLQWRELSAVRVLSEGVTEA